MSLGPIKKVQFTMSDMTGGGIAEKAKKLEVNGMESYYFACHPRGFVAGIHPEPGPDGLPIT
jgi:hypothetical protein